jgi:hypothetical protein
VCFLWFFGYGVTNGVTDGVTKSEKKKGGFLSFDSVFA